MTQRVAYRRQPAGPIGEFVGPLESEIIGTEETAEPGRIGGTAQVLEQQSIEQSRPLLVGQPHHLGEPHPDETGPDRVPLGLAFGDVEGVAQGGNHLGEADGVGRSGRDGKGGGGGNSGRDGNRRWGRRHRIG